MPVAKVRLVFDITLEEYNLFSEYAYNNDITKVSLFRKLCETQNIFPPPKQKKKPPYIPKER